MKNIISALSLVLLSTATANAEAVHVSRVDLYATCMDYLNDSGKKFRSEMYTATQLEELDPYLLKTLALQCTCTVDEAFEYLSQDTIQALNTSFRNGIGDIIPGKTKASLEFQKAGIEDKQIACNSKAMKTTGFEEKIKELSK